MPGRVRVRLEAFISVEVVGRLEQPRTQAHDLLVGGTDIVDVDVEVDLLLLPAVRPLRSDVVRCELKTQARLAVDEHGVPVIVRVDRSGQQPGPEGALGVQIGSIENDYLPGNPHSFIVAQSAARVRRRRRACCGAVGLCGNVSKHGLPAKVFTGIAMGVIFAPLHLLIALVPAAIGLLILYWVIRLAVRHGIRDSRK